jgi:hypothetical protein
MKGILDHFEREEDYVEDWRIFVGPGADYYVREWKRLRAGGYFSFNTHAFIFNVLWLLYRRMWRTAIIFLSFYFALNYLEKTYFYWISLYFPPHWWFYLRLLLFAAFLGMTGNWLYLEHAERRITEVRRKHAFHSRAWALRRAGGGSLTPIAIFSALLALSVFLGRHPPDWISGWMAGY